MEMEAKKVGEVEERKVRKSTCAMEITPDELGAESTPEAGSAPGTLV